MESNGSSNTNGAGGSTTCWRVMVSCWNGMLVLIRSCYEANQQDIWAAVEREELFVKEVGIEGAEGLGDVAITIAEGMAEAELVVAHLSLLTPVIATISAEALQCWNNFMDKHALTIESKLNTMPKPGQSIIAVNQAALQSLNGILQKNELLPKIFGQHSDNVKTALAQHLQQVEASNFVTTTLETTVKSASFDTSTKVSSQSASTSDEQTHLLSTSPDYGATAKPVDLAGSAEHNGS